MDHVFSTVFGFETQLCAETSDHYFDTINEALATPDYLPRALLDRFNIEVIATTEGPCDPLEHHKMIDQSAIKGRVITAYRPDSVVDPDHERFQSDLIEFGRLSGEDVTTFKGYLSAHLNRRAFFKSLGATSTDHGHPTAKTADLSPNEAEALFAKIVSGRSDAHDHELFRAQMLTEMARMSIEDGLVLQIHPGAHRNHNGLLFGTYGRDKGADVPSQTEYVEALKPLLTRYGNEKDLSIIVFTLDETNYARELAPLAGHYPAMKLGPAWWFHDCPEGMQRFREQITPVAGFYNTVGFNDDTRAFFSIPARHDMARRMDARYLAQLVCEHRIDAEEAFELIYDLSYGLAKTAYKL